MHFLINHDKKIIFGWSAKCACSTIKKIFYFLKNNKLDNKIGTIDDWKEQIPSNIHLYTTILFTRNPFKRLVSGFLDKYNKNGKDRWRWNRFGKGQLTFSKYVDILINTDFIKEKNSNNLNGIVPNWHHFTPQTTETYDYDKLIKSKELIVVNIEGFDYEIIEKIYDKKIPDELINYRHGHERKKYDKDITTCVCDLNLDDIFNYNIDYKLFYNEIIKEKVLNYYKDDFELCKQFNIIYDI